jgi:hypothetical protein
MATNLNTVCACQHPAYMHRTKEQRTEDFANGHSYVSECAGRIGGVPHRGPVCLCQVDRATVLEAADG